LPGKLSKGQDGLPNYFYKKLAVVLALLLSLIFEASLTQSTLPNDWRSAKVMPIFKRSGKNSDPSGYRPVSLTCVACKIMEKAIKSAIVEHCRNNKLLPDFQHGGRQYQSTTTQSNVLIHICRDLVKTNRQTQCFLIFRKHLIAFPIRN